MKVGVLITARLKSSRLPRKVLRTLGDKPMIAHLIDRMRHVHLADSVSVITSIVDQDNDLELFCQEYGVNCYRGHPDDVLLRINDAAIDLGLDWVLSVTADNPWVCPEWADRLLLKSITADWDFGKIEGLPFGSFSYVLKRKAIDKACQLKATSDTEVWGNYFKDEFGFSTGVLKVPKGLNTRRPDYRLTVDTPEDFKLAEEIEKKFHDIDYPIGLNQITEFLDKNPKMLDINKNIEQANSRPILLKNMV